MIMRLRGNDFRVKLSPRPRSRLFKYCYKINDQKSIQKQDQNWNR